MSGEGLFHSHLNSARGANLSWGERPQTRLLPNTGTVSKGDICAGGAAQANIRGKERSYKREATTTRSLGTFVKWGLGRWPCSEAQDGIRWAGKVYFYDWGFLSLQWCTRLKLLLITSHNANVLRLCMKGIKECKQTVRRYQGWFAQTRSLEAAQPDFNLLISLSIIHFRLIFRLYAVWCSFFAQIGVSSV